MTQKYLLCIFLLKLSLAIAYTTNYEGYQLWRVDSLTEDRVPDLIYWIKGVQLDVWASGISWIDFLVPPYLLYSLDDALKRQGLRKKVLIQDLQSNIYDEENELLRKKNGNIIGEYLQFEEIESYLNDLASTYDWVSVESIGQTYEGRDLWVAKLSVTGDDGAPKPSVWIDCGTHPRAWISQATCVYGLSMLTESYSIVDEVTEFLDLYDVYIMPVLNPDGYYYTWHNDRFWRKNRGSNNRANCVGVDLNVNYDDGHWGGVGTSDNPCSEIYKGSSGFSELETQAVRGYTLDLMTNNNLTAFFSLTSYGQMWMYPYGWTSDLPPDSDDMYQVSKIGTKSLTECYGTSYYFGTIYNVIYPSTGSSVDWAYASGVIHSYSIALRDSGLTGFLLPATQIRPCGEETWHGIIQAILSI